MGKGREGREGRRAIYSKEQEGEKEEEEDGVGVARSPVTNLLPQRECSMCQTDCRLRLPALSAAPVRVFSVSAPRPQDFERTDGRTDATVTLTRRVASSVVTLALFEFGRALQGEELAARTNSIAQLRRHFRWQK